eukprot:scaffold88344_cov29-Attheya_sp.AAC.6
MDHRLQASRRVKDNSYLGRVSNGVRKNTLGIQIPGVQITEISRERKRERGHGNVHSRVEVLLRFI